jgi:hypothetical protein
MASLHFICHVDDDILIPVLTSFYVTETLQSHQLIDLSYIGWMVRSHNDNWL